MQDTIILGNGTSKQIKTASLPNSYADFKTMAENGNLFADINLNADGCEVVGTPLNKLNLLTDETAGKIGNPENIDEAIEKLHSTINGIPVDLTGIYNTQVIGYDETQGKLVPMINVAKTETIFPTSEDPKPWVFNNISQHEANESNIEGAGFRVEWTELKAGDEVEYTITSTRPYMLSEFTQVQYVGSYGGGAYPNTMSDILFLEFSKTPDFSQIDATSVAGNISGDIYMDITYLKGAFYWRFKTAFTVTNAGTKNFRINQMILS